MPSTPELDAAVDYAVQVFDGYRAQLAGLGLEPDGLSLLELGPGADLGPALLLAGAGARVSVADRFLVSWGPALVARYRRLAERLAVERPELSLAALEQVLEEGRHEGALTCRRVGIEQLDLPAGSLDVCLSNAVLEHVHDLRRACRRLAALTAAGGYGCHQVDFRDHRDFSRPLEHLGDPALARAWRHWRHRGALGSALRADDYAAAFTDAGFALLGFEANLHADPGYLSELAPRLRGRFRGLAPERLAVLSGRFRVRRLS